MAVGVFYLYSRVFNGRMFAALMPVSVIMDQVWYLAGGKEGEVEVGLGVWRVRQRKLGRR